MTDTQINTLIERAYDLAGRVVHDLEIVIVYVVVSAAVMALFHGLMVGRGR